MKYRRDKPNIKSERQDSMKHFTLFLFLSFLGNQKTVSDLKDKRIHSFESNQKGVPGVEIDNVPLIYVFAEVCYGRTLTVSFRTVMKLMCKFFLDSKSDNNLFKSDFVTRLSTPASSTTYDSLGGPSLRISNSEANALPLGKSGLKLSARVRARAASPCWA